MIDFSALHARAQADPDAISRELDPRYVLHVHGHHPVAEEAGRALYHSPFRPDAHPSYTVRRLEDGRYRCGDHAHGTEGDVLDLLRELNGGSLSFSELTECARLYLAEQRRDAWQAPALTRTARSVPVQERVIEVIRTAPLTALTAFLAGRTGALADVPAEYLRQAFGVAEIGPDLLIPYTDATGAIAALKRRAPGEGTRSLPGYRYGDLLYGMHLLHTRPGRPVFLCEGETDTWAVAWFANAVAVGVPAGASVPPSPAQLAALSHRTVYVCFDADEAGDAGAALWPFPRLRPPEGADLASLPTDQLKELLTCLK